MRPRSISGTILALAAMLTLIACEPSEAPPGTEAEAVAGAGPAALADIPRLTNGKPNFSGVWQSLTTANWDLQTHGAAAGPPEYGALLATPPGPGIVVGDEIPYLPEAAARQQRNYSTRFTDDPELKCYMPGVPRANYMPYPFQIFHSDEHMLIAYQFAGAARIV
ncbi:MAG TPA: hypothetical protein VMR74_02840, partial [Gammaproteobacteria bacterium]|nr:hypothetical protein [Gammaproteobacteria bacterium]